jgi:ribosome-binding ATPase YchF (GTP1/OBG family)
VPIELLDVAGLVPGAHLGKGLGNRFLDDLRHADALVHVVDVSGCTDAEGKLGLGRGKEGMGVSVFGREIELGLTLV